MYCVKKAHCSKLQAHLGDRGLHFQPSILILPFFQLAPEALSVFPVANKTPQRDVWDRNKWLPVKLLPWRSTSCYRFPGCWWHVPFQDNLNPQHLHIEAKSPQFWPDKQNKSSLVNQSTLYLAFWTKPTDISANRIKSTGFQTPFTTHYRITLFTEKAKVLLTIDKVVEAKDCH